MFTKEDNQVLDRILQARWTCRSFGDEIPDKEEVEAVIEAGRIAPFASISSKDVTPFRHFFVLFKGDPRLQVIDRLIREQSAVDLEMAEAEAEVDPFLMEHMPDLRGLWSNVAQNGVPVFPDPPCMIVAAEWRGARRAERQSLAHMMENMWLKATALNLDFGLLSVIESMVDNQEFCDLFGLPVERYGFLACVLGHHKGEVRTAHPATAEIHWPEDC